MAVVEKLKSAEDEIRRVRIDMAAAYHLAAKLGMSEGIDNHFSARLPGTTDRFFMNPERSALVGGHGQRRADPGSEGRR